MPDDSPPSPESEPVNPALQDALDKGRPRYFRASSGAARGRTGRNDTEKFAENLMTLQECAQLIGIRLEMHSVAYGMIYDGDETIAFRFDSSSNPHNPDLVGSIVNRRLPMREALSGLTEYMNE